MGSSMERLPTYITEALADCVFLKVSDMNQNHGSPSASRQGGFGDYPKAEASWLAFQAL